MKTVKQLLIIFLVFSLTGCKLIDWLEKTALNAFVGFKSSNRMLEACNNGAFVNTPIYCNGYRNFNSGNPQTYQGGAGLVIMIDPGPSDIRMMASLLGESGGFGAIPSFIVDKIKPHFRGGMNNLFFMMMSHILEKKGKKYDALYYVGENTDTDYFRVIKAAALRHERVDIFVMGHGAPGTLSFSDANGWRSKKALNLVAYSKFNMGDERNRIRAIFSTLCYSGTGGGEDGLSLARAYTIAFPYSVTIGNTDINYGGLHRDMVAFDAFYSGNYGSVTDVSFAKAYAIGNTNLLMQPEYDSGGRFVQFGPRTYMTLGSMRIHFKLNTILSTWQAFSTPNNLSFSISANELDGSKAFLFYNAANINPDNVFGPQNGKPL